MLAIHRASPLPLTQQPELVDSLVLARRATDFIERGFVVRLLGIETFHDFHAANDLSWRLVYCGWSHSSFSHLIFLRESKKSRSCGAARRGESPLLAATDAGEKSSWRREEEFFQRQSVVDFDQSPRQVWRRALATPLGSELIQVLRIGIRIVGELPERRDTAGLIQVM
jgi:hypothetical protein